MISKEEYLLATTAAQALMRTESPSLLIDGKWGDHTNGVYSQISGALRSKVDAAISAVGGKNARELRTFRVDQKLSEKHHAPMSGIVQAALRAAAVVSGEDYDTLRKFAYLESRFNPNAQNGSSRGLMQIQPQAWEDVSKKVTPLPNYASSVFDPVINAKVGALYIRLNKKYLDGLGYSGPWDVAHKYLAHQQGAGGLVLLWKAHLNGSAGGSGMVSANLRKNPPQDGRGPTDSAAEFYRRWVAHVNSLAAKV